MSDVKLYRGHRVPTTEAGRRHAEEFTVALVARPDAGGLTWDECFAQAGLTVLAIEAEARADARADAIREVTERLPGAVQAAWFAHCAAMEMNREQGFEVFDTKTARGMTAAILAILAGDWP